MEPESYQYISSVHYSHRNGVMVKEMEKTMKMTIRKGKAYLKTDGELTVARAADFKGSLVRSLEKCDTVEISLDDMTSIDLACLQLLCSAHRTACKKGKKLIVREPLPSAYLEARRDAGFMFSKPCREVTTEECLWTGDND